MSLFSLTSPIRTRQAPSLHRRFIIGAGLGGALVVAMLTVTANALLWREIAQQGDARVADAAGRALIVVNEALAERTRQAKVLALSPEVVSAAREGGTRARTLGIVGKNIDTLEKQFSATHSMLAAPATRLFLRDLLPQLEAVDMMLTDANGYNAVLTDRSADFVQSDEDWWQITWRDGISPAEAAFDSSARQFTVSLAAVVRDGSTKVGVLKLKSSVAPLIRALGSAGAGARVDILDSADMVLLSSESAAVGRVLRGMPTGTGGDSARSSSITSDTVAERAAALRANSGQWRIVAHLPESEIVAPFHTARVALLGATAALLVVLILLLAAMNQFLQKRIFIATRELAEAAEAVASGDFSVQLRQVSADDEIGRLSRAIGAMILELRRLAQTIAGSARETNAMSAEITAGSEEMAATAGEIAHTASDLSSQSTTMAETIASLAVSANSLRVLSAALDSGARDGVVRNTTLRTLALENRVGLDVSAEALGSLAADVHASAAAIAALSDASEEIRSFVTLVRKLARQSKLLALNAAMEAARAGAHGAGFAVVATEVKRLAAMSSDAAERTEAVVKSVLRGIDQSRELAGRTVVTADEVRATTAKASESFSDIERAVADAEAWTASIEHTAVTTSELVVEMTRRLDSLASGTEAFAAAMQQVAASSEEQSASTQEIAGAANALGSAAERLSKLVSGLKA